MKTMITGCSEDLLTVQSEGPIGLIEHEAWTGPNFLCFDDSTIVIRGEYARDHWTFKVLENDTDVVIDVESYIVTLIGDVKTLEIKEKIYK